MKYFTIGELSSSCTAKKRGIDNTPPKSVVCNLENLINNLLDPLRETYGKPINISSGYRCPKLNALVGGVSNSDHKFGYAADISNGYEENVKLYNLVIKLKLPHRQMIFEGTKSHGTWLHVSYNDKDNKGQDFSIPNP